MHASLPQGVNVSGVLYKFCCERIKTVLLFNTYYTFRIPRRMTPVTIISIYLACNKFIAHF